MIDIGADLQRAFDEGYEKGKADEHRWWSEHCANCTDADRPQGEWVESPYENADGMTMYRCSECGCLCGGGLNYCFKCGAKMRDDNVETD